MSSGHDTISSSSEINDLVSSNQHYDHDVNMNHISSGSLDDHHSHLNDHFNINSTYEGLQYELQSPGGQDMKYRTRRRQNEQIHRHTQINTHTQVNNNLNHKSTKSTGLNHNNVGPSAHSRTASAPALSISQTLMKGIE